jgi:hypothetical protein
MMGDGCQSWDAGKWMRLKIFAAYGAFLIRGKFLFGLKV